MNVNPGDVYTENFYESMLEHNLLGDKKLLPIITIYYNTKDYPGKYVARLFMTQNPTRLMSVADTKIKLLKAIPKYMTKFNRNINDAKEIVEVWL